MKRTTKYVVSSAIVFLMSINTFALSSIKRVEAQYVTPKSTAMALETHDGYFYDISQVRGVRKKEGNVKKILKKNTLKIRGGERIDISQVKFFFIKTKNGFKPVKEAKRPADEE